LALAFSDPGEGIGVRRECPESGYIGKNGKTWLEMHFSESSASDDRRNLASFKRVEGGFLPKHFG
jgi:hypothetical protein